MAEEKPASKKDFKDVIGSLAVAQAAADEKRAREDQIKFNETSVRFMEIGKELKTANATKTLKLEEEKAQLQQERNDAAAKVGTGKRAIEIQKDALELQKAEIEAAGGVATDNKEYRIGQLTVRKEELALRKQGAQGKAAREEIKTEEKQLRDDRFSEFLGPGSILAKGFKGLKNKLGNLTGPAKGILSTLGTVAALAALAAFLQSETWKKLKDKIIPALAKILKGFVESISDFIGKFADFIVDPSWATFTSMFTGKSSKFILGLIAITALLNPLKSLKLLRLAAKGLIGGVKLFSKGISAITRRITGKKVTTGPLSRGVSKGAKGVAKASRGLIRGVAPLAKIGLRGLATGAKFIPGIGLAVTAAMGIFDGMTAGIEEYKKSGKIGKAVEAGIAGAASGLTFGLVSQETFQKGIDGIKAGATKAWNIYKGAWVGIYTGIKTFMKDPKGTLLAVKDKITTSVSDAAGKISDKFTEITGVELPSFADVKASLSTIGKDLTTKLSPLKNLTFPKEISFSGIKDALTTNATAINDSFKNITGIDVKATLGNIGAGLKTKLSALKTGFEDITGLKIPTFTEIQTKITEVGVKAKKKFEEITGMELPTFADVKSKFAEMKTSFLSFTGITIPSFADLKTKVTDFGAKIKNIELPTFADVKTKFTELGTSIGTTISNIELPTFADVKSKFAELGTKLKLPSFDDIKTRFIDFGTKIKNIELPTFADVKTKFTELSTSIGTTISNIELPTFAGIKTKFAELGTKLKLPSFADISTKFTELGTTLVAIELPTFADLKTKITTFGTTIKNIELPTFADVKTKFTELGTTISNIELPTFADLKTKFTDVADKIKTMKVPSFASVGTALGKFRKDTEELTGIKLPDFSDVKGMIEDKLSFKFADLKLPEFPDIGAIISDALRAVLKPLADLEFKVGFGSFAKTFSVRSILPQSFLDFVDKTGSYKPIKVASVPQKDAAGMTPSAAMARGGQAGLNVIMGGSTTNNQGTIVSTNRDISVTPQMLALLNSH